MLSSTASSSERVISRQDPLAFARRTITDLSGAKPANQPDEEINFVTLEESIYFHASFKAQHSAHMRVAEQARAITLNRKFPVCAAIDRPTSFEAAWQYLQVVR
jgi:hypothetical protein